MKDLRILFLGSPSIALPSLIALCESHHKIVEVWTQPDKPKGRGRRMSCCPVKDWALRADLSVFQPEHLQSPELVLRLKDLNPDLLVVIAYGKILPLDIIRIPMLGCLNVHFSLLPKYRGSSCVAQSILNGDKITGATTMLIGPGEVDSGPILLEKSLTIHREDTTESLSVRLAELAPSVLLESIEGLACGQLKPKPQDATQASKAPRFEKRDGEIHWNLDAERLECFVRAMNPWPGAFSFLEGQKIILCKTRLVKESLSHLQSGQLVWLSKKGLFAGCGSGYLEIQELIPQGKRSMSGGDFARGALKEGKIYTFDTVDKFSTENP